MKTRVRQLANGKWVAERKIFLLGWYQIQWYLSGCKIYYPYNRHYTYDTADLALKLRDDYLASKGV